MAATHLMVPVGDGIGDTKGEVRTVSILSGRAGLEDGCERGGPISSSREVNTSLICVEGNLMMHL